MTKAFTRLLPALALGVLVTGCASDDVGGLFSTAAITPAAPPAATVAATPAPRVDAACLQLAGQIDHLKKDGTIEKLEKVAGGKSTSVQVKRAAIAKQAELNKANADYIAKCGPSASRTAAAPAATITPVAGSNSGVTVAPKTQ